MQTLHGDYANQTAGTWVPPDRWQEGVHVVPAPGRSALAYGGGQAARGEEAYRKFASRHPSMDNAWGGGSLGDFGGSSRDLALRIDREEVHPRNRRLLEYAPGYAGYQSGPGAGSSLPANWSGAVVNGPSGQQVLFTTFPGATLVANGAGGAPGFRYSQPERVSGRGPFMPSLAAEGFAGGPSPYGGGYSLVNPSASPLVPPYQGMPAGHPAVLAAGDARPSFYGPPGPRGQPPPGHLQLESGGAPPGEFRARPPIEPRDQPGVASWWFGKSRGRGRGLSPVTIVLIFVLLIVVALMLMNNPRVPNVLVLTAPPQHQAAMPTGSGVTPPSQATNAPASVPTVGSDPATPPAGIVAPA